MSRLSPQRVHQLLAAAARLRVLVIGDVMLDQFVRGRVSRISPEAPVPVLEFESEEFMPGGAANVARNLTALGAGAAVVGIVGADDAGAQLRRLLARERVSTVGLVADKGRATTRKTRIIAHHQHIARVDRESRGPADKALQGRVISAAIAAIGRADAVLVGDYGKGLVTQPLLNQLRRHCRARGVWLGLDPKPVHALKLSGLSLITPNRREAFALAGMEDTAPRGNPLADAALCRVAKRLLATLTPSVLLITLGDQGMLLCRSGRRPLHVPTAAREVFDVSGAGDTVIASFTLAMAAGASPEEAAEFSNHAAGVVVGKVGTATVTPAELMARFATSP